MKSVIVSGASGFIGRSLVIKLLANEIKVYALVRDKRKLEDISNPLLVVIETNKINTTNLEHEIGEDEIDIFYQVAWDGMDFVRRNDIEIQKNNISMSVDAIVTAIEIKCKKFVFCGTNQQYLYDLNKIDGQNSYCGIYGASKAAADRLCKSIALGKIKYNCTLFTNVYGYGDKSKRTTNLFIKKLIGNENLELINGENLYDWTYIDDAIAGLIQVGLHGHSNKEYYIGSRKLKTFKEIIEDVRDVINPKGILKFGTFQDTSFTDYSLVDLDALYNDTGFECKADFKESILKTAQWVKTLDF